MPPVTLGDAVPLLFDLLLTFQLAFSCRVQLGLSFLGLAALAQFCGAVGQGLPINPRRRLAQPRRERLRRCLLYTSPSPRDS